MKAIKLNNRIYKLVEEKGSYVYYIDGKGKIRCILSKDVEVVESIDVEMNSVKVRSKKLNKANFMSDDEYMQSRAGKMSRDEWESYRERKVKESLQSSLR